MKSWITTVAGAVVIVFALVGVVSGKVTWEQAAPHCGRWLGFAGG